MDELGFVYGTAGVILAYFLVQVATRRFDPFAPVWLFLVGYILHHALHGDVHYPAGAAYRSVYLPLLASHVLLAVIVLPMVLVTFFFSLSGRFPQHRRLARWTFPLWLYVSVTGVITYVMLRQAMN